jgi:hypothetical protein
MRIPAALVISVLIWSAARYLPPYYIQLHKMDIEAEKTAIEHTQASVMLKQMRLQMAQAKAKPGAIQHEEHQLY